MNVNALLEYARWVGVGLGFFLANYSGQTPAEQFSILCLCTVLALAGLTGIESVFFGRGGAQRSGYKGGGAYQRQSGFNNLALAITTVMVYVFHWGTLAEITVMTVLLVFLTLFGAGRGQGFKPMVLEDVLQVIGNVAFILHHQNLFGHVPSPSFGRSVPPRRVFRPAASSSTEALIT